MNNPLVMGKSPLAILVKNLLVLVFLLSILSCRQSKSLSPNNPEKGGIEETDDLQDGEGLYHDDADDGNDGEEDNRNDANNVQGDEDKDEDKVEDDIDSALKTAKYNDPGTSPWQVVPKGSVAKKCGLDYETLFSAAKKAGKVMAVVRHGEMCFQYSPSSSGLNKKANTHSVTKTLGAINPRIVRIR